MTPLSKRKRFVFGGEGGDPWRCATALAVKHRQIELAELLRLTKDVHFGDLPAADRERHDREWLPFEHAEQEAVNSTSVLEKSTDRDGGARVGENVDLDESSAHDHDAHHGLVGGGRFKDHE
jgi:hypothetical protein